MEDDRDFAQWLLRAAHDFRFKAVATPRGQNVLSLVREFAPVAITLDISLPDVDGWKVIDRLKNDLDTRHVPVFIISGTEAKPWNALKHGAVALLTKPINADAVAGIFERARSLTETVAKKLLVIEDDAAQRNSIRELIGNQSANQIDAANAAAAIEALRKEQFDCVVLDLILPDRSGFDLIEEIRRQYQSLPIIVYTGKDLSPEEEARLNRIAQTVIVKDVRSPERLFDQTALWLHREVAKLPPDKQQILRRLHDSAEILAGKKVLIVDDDVRNIFAMTSLLERYRMNVLSAETGPAALELLGKNTDVDAVLMDIMLPEMDGYEAMRAIRRMFGFEALPIIALTAKAMKGDREKCIDAGASDYIAKPVDTERLLTLLRAWLHR